MRTLQPAPWPRLAASGRANGSVKLAFAADDVATARKALDACAEFQRPSEALLPSLGVQRSMRSLLVLAMALTFAGCVTPPGTTTPPTNGTTNTTADMGMLPPPINETKSVQGGLQPVTDPQSNAPCTLPTSACVHHKFDANSTVQMEAALTWGVQANDFDLWLFKDGKPLKGDNAPPPGTSAKLSLKLDPGSYDLVVDPATVSQDTYKLSATFAAAS